MNHNNRLIKQIAHIAFPNIKVLNLQGNSIESVEGLAGMELRVMGTIYLCKSESILVDNCICSTSALPKMSWPSLTVFSFCTSSFIRQ